MVNKNTFPSLQIYPFFIMLCIFIAPFAFAQEATDLQGTVANEVVPATQEGQVNEYDEKDYYYEETSEGIVFVQRLIWDEVPYALHYDVIIEKQIETESEEQAEIVQWEPHDTRNTKTNMVEVSFLAGNYRYKVLVYNLFDMLELESEWFEINIIRTTQPKINSIFPELVYQNEESTGIFRIEGENILGDAIYTLEISGFPEYTIPGFLVEKDEQNKWVDVRFDIDDSKVGEYILVIKNPGGFLAEKGYVVIVEEEKDYAVIEDEKDYVAIVEDEKDYVVIVEDEKDYVAIVEDEKDYVAIVEDEKDYAVIWELESFFSNATFGYITGTMIPNDDIFTYFDEPFKPIGISAQISHRPIKLKYGFVGLELAVYWFRISGKKDGDVTSFNAFPANVNFTYQVPLIEDRLFLDTHAGIGLGFFHNMQFDSSDGTKSPSENVLGPSVNVGAALQLYLYKGLYVAAGFDYILMIPAGVKFQMFTRSISFGWRF